MLDKQIRYVHMVNPVTGQPCTLRVVVTASDVTLWQVDQEIDSEEAFDQIDTEDMGMICMPHDAFNEVMRAYLLLSGEAVSAGVTTLEEAEQEVLAMQTIALEEAEAQAKAEYERDQDEKSRRMESDEHEEAEP